MYFFSYIIRTESVDYVSHFLLKKINYIYTMFSLKFIYFRKSSPHAIKVWSNLKYEIIHETYLARAVLNLLDMASHTLYL